MKKSLSPRVNSEVSRNRSFFFNLRLYSWKAEDTKHTYIHTLLNPRPKYTLDRMPARHIGPGPSTGPSRNQGFLSTAYQELRAPENQSVLRSVAIFGVSLSTSCYSRVPLTESPGRSSNFCQQLERLSFASVRGNRKGKRLDGLVC